jgi:hypothetical protein
MVGMSIKRGCQRSFIAKQPYLDHTICQLIYLRAKHKNKLGEVCHGKNVIGFQHTLGSQLLDVMKAHLMGLNKARFVPYSSYGTSQGVCQGICIAK